MALMSNTSLRCPAISEVEGWTQISRQLRAGERDADTAWSGAWAPWVGHRIGTYGWNTNLSGLELASVTNRAEAPMFGDCARPVDSPGLRLGRHTLGENPLAGLSFDEAESVMGGGFYLKRHNGGINMVFTDGQVDAVPLSQLFALSWWAEEN